MKNLLQYAASLLLLSIPGSQLSTAFAQGTAFTYQGRLNSGGCPANGSYDFRFRLSADNLGSNYIGSPFLASAVPVTNGLFTVTMDFGAGIFTGNTNWLEVDVCTNGLGVYTALSPLQAVTPTPYAIFANTAGNVSGTVSAAQLSGTVPDAGLNGTYTGAVALNNGNNSFSGTFTGSGSGLTDLPSQTNATLNAVANQVSTPINGGGITNVPATNLVGTVAAVNITAGTWAQYGGANNYAAIPSLQDVFLGGAGSAGLAETGSNNVAIGFNAFTNSAAGYNNVIVGTQAGQDIGASYHDNTAIGNYAMYNGLHASHETAIGGNALFSDVGGSGNTAVGWEAGYYMQNGAQNTFIGYQSAVLSSTVNGKYNSFLGASTGDHLTSGTGNILIGCGVDIGATWTNYLSIGNVIFGTNVYGNYLYSSNAVPTGMVGIDNPSPQYALDVAGAIHAANGFISGATNNTVTVGSTGWTNNTGADYTVWLTAATGLSLYNNAGASIFTAQTVSSLTPIPVQVNGCFTGTAITAVGENAQ